MASSDHCSTHAKECNKKKRGEEDGECIMPHGIDVNIVNIDRFQQELWSKQHLCKEFLDEMQRKFITTPV
eukprot:7279218-Ditylum_brightwellii.AAC.1